MTFLICYTVRYDFGYSEEFRPQIYANQRAREAGDGSND